MTDTFRALCAEVLAFNNGESPYNFSGLTPYDRDIAAFDAWQDIRQRLKSALRQAQPEPEAPTDEELQTLLYYQFTTSTGHGETSDPIGFARAVLARWGRPSIEPVPVSERLPRPEDCNEMGQFYAWDGNYWWMTGMAAFDETAPYVEGYTHWLPHWALPVPAQHS